VQSFRDAFGSTQLDKIIVYECDLGQAD
jgi:hypothetical protein